MTEATPLFMRLTGTEATPLLPRLPAQVILSLRQLGRDPTPYKGTNMHIGHTSFIDAARTRPHPLHGK